MAEWLERFHPRTALKMKLVRLFLLYVSSLYVLIIALFTLSTQCVSQLRRSCGLKLKTQISMTSYAYVILCCKGATMSLCLYLTVCSFMVGGPTDIHVHTYIQLSLTFTKCNSIYLFLRSLQCRVHSACPANKFKTAVQCAGLSGPNS